MTDFSFLDELYSIIESKRGGDASASYVASLFGKGTAKIAQKVGEEGVETAIAAMKNDRQELIYESADLIFHLMVLLAEKKIPLQDIVDELYGRQCKVKSAAKPELDRKTP